MTETTLLRRRWREIRRTPNRRSLLMLQGSAGRFGPIAQAAQMIVLTVTYMIQAGHEEHALEYFRALKQETLKEPGNIAYLVHQSPTEPRRFFLYEQYLDEAAMDEHRASRHFGEHATNGIMKIMESRQPEIYALID